MRLSDRVKVAQWNEDSHEQSTRTFRRRGAPFYVTEHPHRPGRWVVRVAATQAIVRDSNNHARVYNSPDAAILSAEKMIERGAPS